MNVKKRYPIVVLIIALIVLAGCGGSPAGGTPTRTPKAGAANGEPTQTPWIVYVPVTNTPEPFTVTPLPTVQLVAAQPTKAPTKAPATKAPAPVPAAPKASPIPAAPPTSAPPTNTPLPACGQTYQVTQLTFPENGATRDTKAGSGAAKTIQFMWNPVSSYKLDPKIGYQVIITGASQGHSAVIYISHNAYLEQHMAILSQQATYGLTNQDDTAAKWNVTVVMASGGFDDQNQTIIGTAAPCGGPSPTFLINLRVIQ